MEDFKRQNALPKNEKSLDNEEASSRNLSEVDEEGEQFGAFITGGVDAEEEEKEILKPTFENMKRYELKNQRKDIGTSLATSNILDLLNQYRFQAS